VELEKDEVILWKRGANLKIKCLKISGTLFITNRKIIFKPFLSKKELKIGLNEIKKVEIIKGFIKRMKIIAGKKEYIFFTKNVIDVAHLIKSLS